MSSHCLARLLIAAIALLAPLAACDREERNTRGQPLPDTIPATGSERPDTRAASFENNAAAISQGQQLFSWMNCVGCHAHGGGGMGPALMDSDWRYGGSIEQIAATIVEGRPNGMPSFRGKLTEDQVWQIAAYVRSLSGQTRKDAVAARSDRMSNRNPASLAPKERILPEGAPPL
jgi:cytochrome c oxidase cbb3-type subunit III